jgi:hypothetical protein
MDSILILPSADTLTATVVDALEILIERHGFALNWDEANAARRDLNPTTPTRLYSREGTPETVDEAMQIATTFDIPLAVHLDGNTGDETYEWNIIADLTWFDPITGARYEHAAGTITPDPLIPWALAVKATVDPEVGRPLRAMGNTLLALGIINECEKVTSADRPKTGTAKFLREFELSDDAGNMTTLSVFEVTDQSGSGGTFAMEASFLDQVGERVDPNDDDGDLIVPNPFAKLESPEFLVLKYPTREEAARLEMLKRLGDDVVSLHRPDKNA